MVTREGVFLHPGLLTFKFLLSFFLFCFFVDMNVISFSLNIYEETLKDGLFVCLFAFLSWFCL